MGLQQGDYPSSQCFLCVIVLSCYQVRLVRNSHSLRLVEWLGGILLDNFKIWRSNFSRLERTSS